MSKAKHWPRVRVRLIVLEPINEHDNDVLIAELRRKGRKLSVFHAIKHGWGRPGWTMPIDAKGMPPSGQRWAWRVHPDDVPKLRPTTDGGSDG